MDTKIMRNFNTFKSIFEWIYDFRIHINFTLKKKNKLTGSKSKVIFFCFQQNLEMYTYLICKKKWKKGFHDWAYFRNMNFSHLGILKSSAWTFSRTLPDYHKNFPSVTFQRGMIEGFKSSSPTQTKNICIQNLNETKGKK